MKKILFAITLLLGLGVFTRCTDDFEEMNTDPNAVVNLNPAYLFPNLTQAALANYQRNWNLYADLYSQYWANAVGGFGSDRYEYVDGWVSNFWKEFYTEHLRSSLKISEIIKDKPTYSNLSAMNEIIICFWWQRLTDYYGDVPYTGASTGEPVAYTSQKDIYNDLLKRLTVAVNSIKDSKDQMNILNYDLIYGGDILKWQRFGNSLRLRIAMRMSNVDPTTAQKEVKAALDAPGGVMNANSDVAKVPIWKSGWNDYLHQMAWSWMNIVASKTFTGYLYNEVTGKEDPRTPLWLAYKGSKDGKDVAMTKEEKGFSTYKGLENGFNKSNMPEKVENKFAVINLFSKYVDFSGEGTNLMYCPLMNYSEVVFLKAEAALRGWFTGDAAQLYKDGVLASMNYVGVSTDVATTYINALPAISGSQEAKLKRIITQKWIANFPNGAEAWADFRRTDYPDLTLPADGVSGNASVAQGTYVKRIQYPNNQHDLNAANIPAALRDIKNDRMDIKLWWDVAGSEEKDKSTGLMNSNFK